MRKGHPLDRFITLDYPDLADPIAVRELERIPYDERIPVESTYEALQAGAALDPDMSAVPAAPAGVQRRRGGG